MALSGRDIAALTDAELIAAAGRSAVFARMAPEQKLRLVGSFGLFEWELRQGSSVAAARTCAVNVFVFGELFYLFNCRSLRHSMFSLGFFGNRWLLAGAGIMIVLQLLFTYLPAMHTAFGSQPIGLREWVLIISASLVIHIVIEFEK